jgi:hypothetical protein
VHSTLDADGFTAAATAASCVGATTSSLSKIDIITFRPGLRLNRLVLTYLMLGKQMLEPLCSSLLPMVLFLLGESR